VARPLEAAPVLAAFSTNKPALVSYENSNESSRQTNPAVDVAFGEVVEKGAVSSGGSSTKGQQEVAKKKKKKKEKGKEREKEKKAKRKEREREEKRLKKEMKRQRRLEKAAAGGAGGRPEEAGSESDASEGKEKPLLSLKISGGSIVKSEGACVSF